jgi:hypothetical protein
VTDKTLLHLVRIGCWIVAAASLAAMFWLFGGWVIPLAGFYAFSIAMLVGTDDLKDKVRS